MGYLEAIEPEDGRRRFKVLSPVDGSVVGTIRVHNEDDVKAAVERARKVQRRWEATPLKERVRLMKRAVATLMKRRESFIERMTAETGRASLDTLMIEIFAAFDSMNFYARNAEKILKEHSVGLHLLRMKKAKMVYRPLGVIGVISPWNGPFILSLNPTVQAVLAGNTVIVKPSEVTPFSGLLVEELFREAGFPDGVVQVLTGDGETGAALLTAGVDKISFTGSVRTGRKIGEVCGRELVPCTLELGGKDPMIVCDDADVDRAIGGAVFGSMMNAGQFCSAIERVYVHESIADEFTRGVVAKVRELELGRDIGPNIFQKQAALVQSHVDDAVDKGATIEVGGATEGNYFQPSVLTGVDHTMKLMTEETFGPIIPIQTFRTEAEAIRLANDTEFGLGASVWTKDPVRADRIARQLQAGAVTVNETSVVYGALEVPFGGRKSSGVGRVNGADGLKNFCHPLPIITDRFGAKEEAVWYPYTDDKVQSLTRALKVMWGTPLRRLLS